MRTLRRLLLALLAALTLLVAIVAIRTVTYQGPVPAASAAVEVAPATQVDVTRAARNLAAAIQIRTISHQDPRENDPAEWDRLHAWLQSTYPAAHAAMTRELVAGHTL
ncbi:MAG: peptidase M20, partial [Gammaproteobacteria bacterium]|nr:peptidase M20 [Gammaproteobacteria bacterium]